LKGETYGRGRVDMMRRGNTGANQTRLKGLERKKKKIENA